MQLQRREYKPQYKPKEPEKKVSGGNLSSAQKALMVLDMQGEIPRGKYTGKTPLWVKKNDESYWKWMTDKDMMYEWDLYTIKDTAMKPKTNKPVWDKIVATGGYVWCTVRGVDEPGIAVQDIEELITIQSQTKNK